eukprot:11189895-Lingulodinium_polyedra.AAC.1
MPAWGGDWLRWMRNGATEGAWWHWCDACQCFADERHAVGKWHLRKVPWYVPSEPTPAESARGVLDAGPDADVGAPWATSADSPAIPRPSQPAPPPR